MYYVYTLAYPDGTVFYVGKGALGTRPDRMLIHEMEARRGLDSHKCRIIRKIWNAGGEVIKERVATFEIEQDALDFERTLIALYGRDTLANHTDGGDGISGYRMSEQTRERIRAAHLGRKHSETHNARKSAANKGNKPAAHTMEASFTPEVNARRAAALAKTYPGFIAPDGTEYRDITNLHAFCREHGLNPSALRTLMRPDSRHFSYKGWRIIDTEPQERRLTAKTYPGFVAPDGTEYRNIENLSAFCREHNLDVSSMAKVASRQAAYHRGWTLLEL